MRFRVVRIAKKEWESWGSPLTINGKIVKTGGVENQKGFAEKVGEYWKIGTGQNYDGYDTNVAWSSAFISYIMKQGGAGDKFVYSSSHSKYITDSIANRKKGNYKAPFVGYKIDEVEPQVGDLVCYSRQGGVSYDTTGSYLSHCDIVVAKKKNEIEVIGGNVSQTVMKNILKTDDKGKLVDKSQNFITIIKTNI